MNATHKHEASYPVDHLLDYVDEHAWSLKASEEAWFRNPAQMRGNQQQTPAEPKHQQGLPLCQIEMDKHQSVRAQIHESAAVPALTLEMDSPIRSHKHESHQEWLEGWKVFINRAPESSKEKLFNMLAASQMCTRQDLRVLFADTKLASRL